MTADITLSGTVGESSNEEEDFILPPIREELQIMEGSPLLGGAPSWMIYDPVQAQYYQISIEMFELLAYWKLGKRSYLLAQVKKDVGRSVTDEELASLHKFLLSHNLLQDSGSGSYRDFYKIFLRSRENWFKRITLQYLFFRIPLIMPAVFLEKTLSSVKFIFSKYFLLFILLIALAGFYLVSRQSEVFFSQFQYMFTFSGLTIYFVGLLIVKIFHELGHAYTATYYGTRVSTMGVAFMVMIPILYTDTTDAWRLKSSKKRVLIDAAGMLVELSIAGLATFLWVFLDDGPLRSAVFALATTTWVLSLLFNLNPLMRFDGYYLLSDFFGIKNLQPRSFKLGRWKLREFLFGLRDVAPEPNHKYRTGMITYCYMVWFYRFFLFIGIALLMYLFAFKVLGIILAWLEIYWFIWAPLNSELKVWWQRRMDIFKTGRSRFTLGCGLVMCLLFFIPWNGIIHIPAIYSAQDIYSLYPREEGYISGINIAAGASVQQGDVLIEIQSPSIDYDIQISEGQILLLQQRISRGISDLFDKEQRGVIESQLATEQEKLAGFMRKREELTIRAPTSGVMMDLNENIQLEQWVNPFNALGTVIDPSKVIIQGYVSEHLIERVESGQEGLFIPDDILLDKIHVRLTAIGEADNDVIRIKYLSSLYGGGIASLRDEKGDIVPTGSIYTVDFIVLDDIPKLPQVLTGSIRLHGQPRSFANRIWKKVAGIFVREFGI